MYCPKCFEVTPVEMCSFCKVNTLPIPPLVMTITTVDHWMSDRQFTHERKLPARFAGPALKETTPTPWYKLPDPVVTDDAPAAGYVKCDLCECEVLPEELCYCIGCGTEVCVYCVDTTVSDVKNPVCYACSSQVGIGKKQTGVA